VSVNWDATTATVRSLTISNAGSGYQTTPALVILNTGAGTGASATVFVPINIAGQTSSSIQKSAIAVVNGAHPINSSQ